MLRPNEIAHIPEAGCDEAGRGPLAGSVFAAAVIWDVTHIVNDDPMLALLNDSKQLTEKQRYRLRSWIEQNAVAWAVGESKVEEIDRLNILNAAILAMHRALEQLHPQPEHILVDGNRFKPYLSVETGMAVPHKTVVKGDGKYMSIAAASILAKTYRDDYMMRLHQIYPQYGWDKNKGYPTKDHYAAIAQYGITPYHRQTFRLV